VKLRMLITSLSECIRTIAYKVGALQSFQCSELWPR
jgi:hypothetical protein